MISSTAAVALSGDVNILPLWPQGVPDAKDNGSTDIPDITVHLPPAEKTNGIAIQCPRRQQLWQ